MFDPFIFVFTTIFVNQQNTQTRNKRFGDPWSTSGVSSPYFDRHNTSLSGLTCHVLTSPIMSSDLPQSLLTRPSVDTFTSDVPFPKISKLVGTQVRKWVGCTKTRYWNTVRDLYVNTYFDLGRGTVTKNCPQDFLLGYPGILTHVSYSVSSLGFKL